MYLPLFLFIALFFSLSLGEFGQYPFGQTNFSISLTDVLIFSNLAVMLIWNIAIKKDLTVPKNFYWLAGFWAVCLLSLFSSFNFSGWFYLLRFIVYSGTFYLAFHLVKSKILDQGEFLTLLKIVSVIVAVLGLIQFFIFPDLEPLTQYGYDPHKNRLFSTFLDPNFAGTFLSFSLIFITNNLLSKKISDIKQFFTENKTDLVSGSLILISIILTFSRSAYLMLFAGLFILLLIRRKLLLIPLFLIPLILYLVFPPFSERLNGVISLDKSASERILSWEKGLTIFQQNPLFGVGFNNIRDAAERLNLNKTYSSDGGNSGAGVDSSLIFVMATTGIAGIAVFFLFLLRIFFDLIMRLVRKKSRFALPFSASFAGLILNSFFINSLFFPAIMVLWFSALGVFLGSQSEARTASSAYRLGEGDGEA